MLRVEKKKKVITEFVCNALRVPFNDRAIIQNVFFFFFVLVCFAIFAGSLVSRALENLFFFFSFQKRQIFDLCKNLFCRSLRNDKLCVYYVEVMMAVEKKKTLNLFIRGRVRHCCLFSFRECFWRSVTWRRWWISIALGEAVTVEYEAVRTAPCNTVGTVAGARSQEKTERWMMLYQARPLLHVHVNISLPYTDMNYVRW